jgi:hypothetical protein
MLYLDRGSALHAGTRLAMRAQLVGAQSTSEALVAKGEAESGHLVIQGTRPHVGVFFEPGEQIRDVLGERIGFGTLALARNTLSIQMGLSCGPDSDGGRSLRSTSLRA